MYRIIALNIQPFRHLHCLLIIGLALSITSANAQLSKNGQLRMTATEIRDAKATGATAPGSSNLRTLQVIVIHGDPSKQGLYTILLKVPPHTKIAAHLHPDERIGTVISGTWFFGYGDLFDKDQLKKLSPGSIYTEVGGQNHFAMTGKKPVVIQITGYGPTGTSYVNAEDDPQKKEDK